MRYTQQQGFALPAVVIVGTVLFSVMTVVLGSTASIRSVLDEQFYQALARDAAESGAAHAKACINDPTFIGGTGSITPQTNCAGTNSGASLYLINNTTSVPRYRTTYTAQVVSSSTYGKNIKVTSAVELLRSNGTTSWKSYPASLRLQTVLAPDPAGDRASKRFWYFGRNGVLDFGASGNALPTVSTSPGSFAAAEGTTVVNDQSGNLLFFSDGLHIWNKAGDPMLNSDFMLGSYSATQAVATFPLNTTRTLYAVVSNTGQGETGLGELYLNIIDMQRSGGLGEVVSKNVMLGAGKGLGSALSFNGNNPDKSYSNEGLNAMPNADGTGYFVYTYNIAKSQIVGFKILTNGNVDPTPITFSLPLAPVKTCLAGSAPNGNIGTYGYGSVNFSSDYTKLVVLIGSYGCSNTPNTTIGTVYVLNVNPSSGAVSDANMNWTATTTKASGSRAGYTADFSPGGGYVYVSQIYPTEISRYSLASPGNVAGSKWVIGAGTLNVSNEMQAGGHIRRGPDGRMYIADHDVWAQAGTTGTQTCKMSYISNPDSPTETAVGIGLNIDGITLGPANPGPCSAWGLPQMATIYVPKVYIY